MVGEDTERLPAVPVGEDCAGLMGLGGEAVGKRDSRRLPHLCVQVTDICHISNYGLLMYLRITLLCN